MDSLDGRLFANLVDDFCEGFWLDGLDAASGKPGIEVDIRHMDASCEGLPEDRILRARKAASVAVSSGNWRPEHL